MKTVRIVSLFCGMGNADAAFLDAGKELGIDVRIVAAFDSWEKAVQVYNANLDPVARVADVKTMSRADLPPHDLVIGGPPCQPFSTAGKRAGHDDPRNCLPDFLRLVGFGTEDESPYLMENVASRLINAPWSEKLCAADFGDVTSRKRWFYSNYLLHVLPNPGPLRIRDIRDHDEDARILKKRGYWTGDEMQAVAEDDEVFPTLTATDFHGTKNNGSGNPTRGSKIRCKAGQHEHYDDTLDTLQAHSWHGHDIRGSGKLLALEESAGNGAPALPKGESAKILAASPSKSDDDVFGTITSSPHGGIAGGGKGHPNMVNLKIGLRSASTSTTATTFNDDEVLGSLLANSTRGNRLRELIGCRNPSLLEMARAHSIPDAWDWCGATKTDRGKMIANSWPRKMGKAVALAILPQIAATSQRGAA